MRVSRAQFARIIGKDRAVVDDGIKRKWIPTTKNGSKVEIELETALALYLPHSRTPGVVKQNYKKFLKSLKAKQAKDSDDADASEIATEKAEEAVGNIDDDCINTWEKARTQKEIWLARIAKLNYEKASGNLLEMLPSKMELENLGISVQKGMLGSIPRIAPLVAKNQEDIFRVSSILEKEFRAVLSELAHGLAQVV